MRGVVWPRTGYASWLAATFLMAACADLPPINANECGNGVVDLDEDCDLFADPALGPGTACAAPSDSARACRYTCSPTVPCPVGWGCAPDGVCRYASGFYEPAPGSPFPELRGDHIAIGESDSDDFPDVMGVSSASVGVLYGSENGAFDDDYTTGIDFPQGAPGFGDLDDDGKFDVVIPLLSGLFVMLSESDRELAPLAFSPFAIPSPGGGVQIMPIRAGGELSEDVMVLAADASNNMCIQFFEEGFENECPPGNQCCFPRRPLLVPHAVSEIAGRVPVDNIDAATPGQEEFALAFSGESVVWVYTARTTVTGRKTTDLIDTVAVPLGQPVLFGARFVDVNADGVLDLMISVGDFSDDQVAVAYGDGTGNFGPAVIEPMFDTLKGGFGPGMGGPISTDGQRWPVGVGDVNNDGYADYIGQSGVYVRNVGGFLCDISLDLCQTVWRTTPDPWIDAQIADFNRDWLPDVAAISELVPGVDFFLGTGVGLFNRYHIDTDFPPFNLRTGDFDGDLVQDLALGQHGSFNGQPVDELSIMYGAIQGAPDDPVSMGKLQIIEYMEPALIIFDVSQIDLISDMIVQSFESYEMRDERSLAILIGSSQRRMLSPFSLQVPGQGFPDIPQAVQVGNFDGDGITDIVAIAPPRLWMVKGAGGAQFNAQDATYTEISELLSGEFEAYCGVWTSGDVNLDGMDDLVAIDYSERCAGFGGSPAPRILIASATGAVPDVTVAPDASGLVAPRELRMVDLDMDSDKELIVVYAGEYFSGTTGPGVMTPEKSGIAVYWNDGTTFDFANPSVVPDFPTSEVGDVYYRSSTVALNADEDRELELAVLTDIGIWIVGFDPATKVFTVPAQPTVFTFGAQRLLSADVNADGIHDLLVQDSGSSGMNVFLAIPHLNPDTNSVPTGEGP